MPDLFLIVSRKDSAILERNIESVGTLLRTATAHTFPDLEDDPTKVAVWIIPHNGGDNIPPLQILGIASWSPERQNHHKAWKEALAGAWVIILDRALTDYKDIFPADKVEVYPLMPMGDWGIVEPVLTALKKYL